MTKAARALKSALDLPGAGIYVELNFQQAWTTEGRWVPLVPAPDSRDRSENGATYNRGLDGRVYIFRDRAGLITQLNAAGIKKPLDINHATELKAPMGEDAPAHGWFSEFRLGADASIEGLLALNALGLADLADLKHRYLSPALSIRWTEEGMEVTGLSSVALTNKPNLTLDALNSQQPTSPTVEDSTMDKQALIKKLGLQPEATDAEIAARLDVALNSQAAYTSVCTKLGVDPSDLPGVARKLDVALNAQGTPAAGMVPKADYEMLAGKVAAMESAAASSVQAARATRAQGLIDTALNAQKISPTSVDYHRKAMETDAGIEAFEAMIKDAPALLATPHAVELNMEGGSKVKLTAVELDMCEQMQIDPKEFAKTKQQSIRA